MVLKRRSGRRMLREVRKLRSHPDFDEKKWKEKYPRLAELDLNATEIREEKGEGYRDYYVEAAKPTGAFVKNNILVGVKEPLENISKDARDLGLVENNQIYPKGTDIGFRNAAKGDFGVAEQCIIKECLGNRHFDAAAVGLYADEFRK